MKRAIQILAIACAALGLLAHSSFSGEVVALKIPEGGVQPDVVVDSKGMAHVVYLKGSPASADAFHIAEKSAGSGEWSAPERVNSMAASAVEAGSIRGAQIALGGSGRLHVVWNGASGADPKAKPGGQLYYTRSRENGPGFEPQRNLITTATGLDGGATVTADGDGRVFVAWHANPGPPGEANRAVYLAVSTDDGRTFSPERRVIAEETGACACCGMRALVDRAGTLNLLYRAARKGEDRDITLLSSRDHGATFALAPVQPWSAKMCPLSSMSLAPTAREGALLAWERSGQVYFSKSSTPAEAISPDGGSGGRKHPVLATNSQGETLLAWTEGTGWSRGGTYAWQVFDAQGKPTARKGKGGPVPVWGTIAVYAQADGRFTLLY